jgi:ribosomal protein S27AE
MKLTTRHLIRGKGRHRPAPIAVPVAQLLGPVYPLPPVQGVLVQAWRDCPPCGKATAGVLHKDGWTCGECLTVSRPGKAAE